MSAYLCLSSVHTREEVFQLRSFMKSAALDVVVIERAGGISGASSLHTDPAFWSDADELQARLSKPEGRGKRQTPRNFVIQGPGPRLLGCR